MRPVRGRPGFHGPAPRWRLSRLAGVALALLLGAVAAPVAAQVGVLEEIRRDVESDAGYVDLVVQGFAPGEPVAATSTELAAPRLVIQTLSPGEANPYVDSPSRAFRMAALRLSHDRTFHAEAEAEGALVDVYVGADFNGNRRADPEEELCRSTQPGSLASCTVPATSDDQWVIAHHRGGDSVPVKLRWFAYYHGYLSQDIQARDGNALVSAPGRVADDGSVTVRLSFARTGMGVGDLRLGRLRVSTPGRTIEAPVRLRRTGGIPAIAFAGPVQDIILEPGQSHTRLAFIAPRGADVAGGYLEHVDIQPSALHVRPMPTLPEGPLLPPAPPLDEEGSYRAVQDPADLNRDVIRFRGELPMLWYLTPVNYGKQRSMVRVSFGAYIDPDGSARYQTVRQGSYYNPRRSGHGVFVYRSGAAVSLLWYTYDEQGLPTWLYAQSPADPNAPAGDLGPTAMPLYRSAWLGDRQRLYEVGSVSLYPITDDAFAMAYVLDGRSGLETLQAFLTGCPSVDGAPLDASGHWFDPTRAGTGYSVQVHPGYEFIANFIYDRLGQPRFLVAERGGAFDAGEQPLVLEQLRGFAPFGPHAPPTRSAVGLLTRRYAGGALQQVTVDAAFDGAVQGDWQGNDLVLPLGQTQGCRP